MSIYKFIKGWIKKYPWALLLAVGSVFGALILLLSKANNISSLDDAVQVRVATREVKRKEAKAQALIEQADASGEEVMTLKREIAASKKRIMEIHHAESLEDKSDDVIARIFTAAGF